MNAPLPSITMTVPEFLTWSARQPETERYELVDGKVISMTRDSVKHNRTKFAIARTLEDAVVARRLSCVVFIDGVGLRVGDQTVRIPDVVVHCGAEPDPAAVLIDSPIIVVEVTSPSSERVDADDKFVDYFALPTIEHYLIVLSGKRVVVHHRRKQDGTIESRILHDGDVVLDPPGLTVPVAALLGPDLGAKEIH